MKPMKKKTSTSKSKVVEESTSTIKNYFKTAPNGRANGVGLNVCTNEKDQKTSDCKAVYIEALKRRLQRYDGETETVKNIETNECNIIQNEYEGAVALETGTEDAGVVASDECDIVLDGKKGKQLCGDESCAMLRKKYDDLKRSHMTLCLQHCELSMKYKAIRKIKDHTVTSTSSESTEVSLPTDNIFTASEIIVLNSLPLEKTADSTFILKCIEYAYKGNASDLVTKSLKGTRERIEIQDNVAVAVRPAKDPMTPEKVKRIEDLFITRVTKSKCLAGELAERVKSTNINRLIAAAIRNISNKEHPKQKSSQKNDNLEL